MRVFLTATTIVLLIAAGGPSTVWGQARSGSSTFGSGGSTFGSGGSGSSSGSLLQSLSSGQLGPQAASRDSSQPGSFIGNSSQTANQGFVGSRNSGAGGSARSQSGSSRSGSSRYGSGQYGSGQYGSNRGRGSYQSSRGGRTSKTEVRTVLRLGFRVARPAATQIAPKLQARLERIMVPGAPSGVQVRVENGTATLQGVVATAHARVIAERLALLEAGIWKVNNELVVADSDSPEDSQ